MPPARTEHNREVAVSALDDDCFPTRKALGEVSVSVFRMRRRILATRSEEEGPIRDPPVSAGPR